MNSDSQHASLRSYSAFVCVFGYLLTVLLCIAGPMILYPPGSRSSYFIIKIVWLALLATAFWGSVGFFLLPFRSASEGSRGLSRVAPAIMHLVTIYSALSALLLIGQTLRVGSDLANRVHIAVQLILFVFVVILALILGLPVFFAPRARSDKKGDHSSA